MKSAPSSLNCGLPPASEPDAEPGRLNTFSAKLEEIFGIDLRSLALFRIGLAGVVLVDLIYRSTDLRSFYTDFGFLPRSALIEKVIGPEIFSFHVMNGTAPFQWLLFSIAFMCGLGMLVGYRTQLTTFLSWLFLISLHSRNPLILQGGDVYIRVLLFWAMFVPMGVYYSVDAAMDTSNKKREKHFYSIGTAALSLQVALIYLYTAGYKWKGVEWQDGSAVYYALSLDYFRTPIGDYFLKFPQLLKALTHYVLWIEILAPFLFFSPLFFGPSRMVGIFCIVSLQMGLNACMELGSFPYISTVATFCCLPTWFWEKATPWFRASLGSDVQIYYDADCGFCKKSVALLKTFLLLPDATVLMAQSDEVIHQEMKAHNSWVVRDSQNNLHHEFGAFIALCRASILAKIFVPVLEARLVQKIGIKMYRRVANDRSFFGGVLSPLQFRPLHINTSGWMSALAAFSLFSVFIWCHTALYKTSFLGPQFIRSYCLFMRLDQSWTMFAPSPRKIDGWYVIDGNLKNGTKVDLFSKKSPVSWEKPNRVEKTFRNASWRKYMPHYVRTNKKYRQYYSEYLCRDWNEKHTGAEQLNDFEIVFMREINGPNYTSTPVKPQRLLKHYCFKAPRKTSKIKSPNSKTSVESSPRKSSGRGPVFSVE